MHEIVDKIISGEYTSRWHYGELKLVGAYLEPDIVAVLNNLSEKGGRGAKTRIINEALRTLFREKGLL